MFVSLVYFSCMRASSFFFFFLNKLLFIKTFVYSVCYISFMTLSKLENEPFMCDRRIVMMVVMALNMVILLKSIY
jgi:hypothetical protein